MSIKLVTGNLDGAKIKVVGVGGGGGNALNTMVDKGIEGVEFIAINTDSQALEKSKAHVKIQIGKNLTKGLGAGMRDDIGLKAVEENREDIARALEGGDMVFITAGFGGGTGTGAAPEIAHIAKTCDCLVVSIVTKPFQFEGLPRMQLAEQGLKRLKDKVDSLIIIPNQKILTLISKDTTKKQAFEIADKVLYNATKGISQIITKPGEINVDFADVKTVMENMGDAMIGTGIASGENRAEKAARFALENPLLDEIDISGSKSVLVNIASNGEITMTEIELINELIKERTNENANYIFGILDDETLTDEIMVTVIATGFNPAMEEKEENAKITVLDSNFEKNAAWVGTGEIKSVPTTQRDLADFDVPAYKRRNQTNQLAINDDMSEVQKSKQKSNLADIGLDGFQVEEEYTPAFLRRSND
jgi:cell division protein FtsZ